MAPTSPLTLRATVSTEHQVTLPDELRAALRIEPGHQLEFLRLAPGEYLVFSAEHPLSLQGMIGKPKRRVTLRGMERAIRARGGHWE